MEKTAAVILFAIFATSMAYAENTKQFNLINKELRKSLAPVNMTAVSEPMIRVSRMNRPLPEINTKSLLPGTMAQTLTVGLPKNQGIKMDALMVKPAPFQNVVTTQLMTTAAQRMAAPINTVSPAKQNTVVPISPFTESSKENNFPQNSH